MFLDKNTRNDVRFLALTQLKNGVEKYWRTYRVPNSISAASRQIIRDRLFQGSIGEGDKRLASYNAFVLAKVVRIDFPDNWPNPFTDLIAILTATKNGNQLELSGALIILQRIIKEMCTARMSKSQTSLQHVTPELVHVLGEVYDAKVTDWVAFLTNGREDDYESGGGQALLAMENSLDALKSIRRLLIVGYQSPRKDKSVQELWKYFQVQFAKFVDFIYSGSSKVKTYSDLIGAHLMQFTKLHNEMAKDRATDFASLPNSVPLVRTYWDLAARFADIFNESDGIQLEPSGTNGSKSKSDGPLLEKLALKGLTLVRACVRMVHYPQKTVKYKSPEEIEEQKEAIQYIKVELLKDELVLQMVNVLITRFFKFREADLAAWDTDPEEWEDQEQTQGNAYEWEVRPCAERLFLDLLTHSKPLLLEPLLSYFSTIQNQQADVVADIVARDAVYTAMGLASALVREDFDFEAVLKTSVIADAQRTGPLFRVLRRRISILLSQWVPVRVTQEARPLVYEIFRHFLDPRDECNDIVVRATAARQFKIVVDDFQFEGEPFLPYASDTLPRLIELVQEVDLDETKLAILETIRSLIQRMDTHVSHFGDMVMTSVPGLWESAGESGYMMKQSILAIIQSLVMSMKGESLRYQYMILSLISQATEAEAELQVYLIDEALDLWSNVLIQTPPPLVPDLIVLVERAIENLIQQNNHAVVYIGILGSYILLAPETMLEDRYRRPTLTALSGGLNGTLREQIGLTIKYTESFIRLAHELGGNPGLQLVVQDMMSVGFLPRIFEDIHDAFEAHQTSGPKKKQPRVGPHVLTDYFVILSRIAVLGPELFVEVLSALGPLEPVWNWLSTEWFSSFDNIADIDRKKLGLLALTRLLEVPQPMQGLVLIKLQDYFSMWTSVLVQVMADPAENPGVDMLVFTSEPEANEWDTPRDVRERALFASDPVKRINSLHFVKESLENLIQRVGGNQEFQNNWAINVDKEVLVAFYEVDKPIRNEA